MYNLYYVNSFKDVIGLTETNCLIRKHGPLEGFMKIGINVSLYVVEIN